VEWSGVEWWTHAVQQNTITNFTLSIVIFDSETAETVQVLTGFHKRAVSQLAFSSDGSLLASAGNDDNHSIAVYDWMANKIISTT
tara:strand:+ start:256 stop:510 length:255 start_codon:yes stop_codon:yes gene_type:complete